jgi:hemoglobin
VIDDFYGRIRMDPLLGPVFQAVIGDGWELHLEKICRFWLTATRLGGHYEGRGFMPAHLKLSGIGSEHMDRWLLLFRQTVDERCSPEAADALFDIAVRMGESILFGLNRTNGELHRQDR